MSEFLRNYKILFADSDQQLSHVVKLMLMNMGFTNVQVTRSGKDVQKMLAQEKFDFLITEWNLQQQDGIDLVQTIRKNGGASPPTLPVIMLTGRAERADVEKARDVGINEYVVKPFTARAIFNRIERIIENPRPFVVSNAYVGPDRRHRGNPPEGIGERRIRITKPEIQPKNALAEIVSGKNKTTLWFPDSGLKQKIGSNVKLQDLITPEVLAKAQASIDAIVGDSLLWIKENLQELETLYKIMVQGEYPVSLPTEIGEVALTINSRAGTFGYTRASEIAYMLYLFCRNHLQPFNHYHQLIVRKHIEILKVVFTNNMHGSADKIGEQIAMELRQLTEKYTA